jgi:catechol 2,3-dioxygenase-like lactoylglutathione lyase family enzyme
MLDHVSIQCADLAASAAFYDAVLAPLGGARIMDLGELIGFRESHFAFTAPSRAAVRAFFDAALLSGAEILHAPRVWPEYHEDYFGAFVRDPDGNNVEAVSHAPE